jgi:hypothetical protein
MSSGVTHRTRGDREDGGQSNVALLIQVQTALRYRNRFLASDLTPAAALRKRPGVPSWLNPGASRLRCRSAGGFGPLSTGGVVPKRAKTRCSLRASCELGAGSEAHDRRTGGLDLACGPEGLLGTYSTGELCVDGCDIVPDMLVSYQDAFRTTRLAPPRSRVQQDAAGCCGWPDASVQLHRIERITIHLGACA